MPSAECRARSAARPGPALAAALALALGGCGALGGDLFPSGADRRPSVVPGSDGPEVGQRAHDLTLPDTRGGQVVLSEALAGASGAVLYFNMWCPICDAHLGDLQAALIPAFPAVRFYAVDYVSGSAAESAAAQAQQSWGENAFTAFLADVRSVQADYFSTYMAVVVLDRDRIVRFKGEYDRARVQAVLAALPPPPAAP